MNTKLHDLKGQQVTSLFAAVNNGIQLKRSTRLRLSFAKVQSTRLSNCTLNHHTELNNLA